MYEKLKSFLADDTYYFAILVLLVGVISFGLGRQSVLTEGERPAASQPAGIVFVEASESDTIQIESNGTVVVGSRSGTKYHLLDCPGAQQMKEENKVFFDSVELAEAAGYTPAANCPGL